ncbi:hypothetical protein B484DRAFT_408824, partial [Ochromonadaceae sp. CCMP2298]
MRVRQALAAETAAVIRDEDELFARLSVAGGEFAGGRARGSAAPKTGMLALLSRTEA